MHNGESTRLPPMWRAAQILVLTPNVGSGVVTVGSLLCLERFSSGSAVFPSPEKFQIPI